MTAEPPKRSNVLVVAIIVAAVLVSATIFIALQGSSTITRTQTVASTSTKGTLTCTINGPDVYDCVTPLRITEAFDFGSGAWNFTVSINATSVVRGQTIRLTASLTNAGGNETVSQLVQPYINPEVVAPNGTIVWQWNAPQSIISNDIFPGGQTISQVVDVPTSELQTNQGYLLSVAPLYVAAPTPNNMSLTTFPFTVTSSPTSASATTPAVDGTFVSRFCSNESAVQRVGAGSSGLISTGSLTIGKDEVSTIWTNNGTAAVSVKAVCIDGVGLVPADETFAIAGSTAETLELVTSPPGPIAPGGQVNITAQFRGGMSLYYMPQGGIGITLIDSDGSSASMSGPRGVGFLSTAQAKTPFASIQNVTLSGGSLPVVQFTLNYSGTNPVSTIDIMVNGTYVGTIGINVSQCVSSDGSPPICTISGSYAIDEPGRITIVSGGHYSVTVVATSGYLETQLSNNVTAG